MPSLPNTHRVKGALTHSLSPLSHIDTHFPSPSCTHGAHGGGFNQSHIHFRSILYTQWRAHSLTLTHSHSPTHREDTLLFTLIHTHTDWRAHSLSLSLTQSEGHTSRAHSLTHSRSGGDTHKYSPSLRPAKSGEHTHSDMLPLPLYHSRSGS